MIRRPPRSTQGVSSAASDVYKRQRKDGKIRFYGMATWECFRVTSENPLFLQLSEVMDLAIEVGGT